MLEQTIERWFEDATMKGVRQGEQKGRREGMQQGVQQGMRQGYAGAVALQLQLRFGPVPAWVQTRLDAGTEEQLTQWLGSVLTAQSMEELFGTDGPTH